MGSVGPVVGDVEHEGWIVPLFADGAEGSGTTGSRGVLVVGQPDEAEEWRPDAAVVGYAAGCACGWRGRPWTRAHSPAAAGASAWHGAEDGPVVDAVNRLVYQPGWTAELDAAAGHSVMEEWREHIAPWTAREAVTETVASSELDDAVQAAGTTGASWADIGRATGMTRQSANERWARLTG